MLGSTPAGVSGAAPALAKAGVGGYLYLKTATCRDFRQDVVSLCTLESIRRQEVTRCIKIKKIDFANPLGSSVAYGDLLQTNWMRRHPWQCSSLSCPSGTQAYGLPISCWWLWPWLPWLIRPSFGRYSRTGVDTNLQSPSTFWRCSKV